MISEMQLFLYTGIIIYEKKPKRQKSKPSLSYFKPIIIILTFFHKALRLVCILPWSCAAIYMEVHITFLISFSFSSDKYPEVWISGLYGSFIFNILRNLHTSSWLLYLIYHFLIGLSLSARKTKCCLRSKMGIVSRTWQYLSIG